MAGDAPFLDRLAQLPAVPVRELLTLLDRLPEPWRDPVIGPLFLAGEDDQVSVNPLVPAVLDHLQSKDTSTGYDVLVQGLTGIWNAAVRAAVVAELRAQGLPRDDLLLRLQALSPTLGFASEENREWARQWVADPLTQDAVLVQQCVVRILLSVRSLAEARAHTLLADSEA